ncbi:P-loop containing nucleoside triphosphate hydrolase protein [Neohortaea acidophila]|uniref:ATP-dependent RNA helicase n=1 Tax=Neohortaea acidophila TaxID=245834 RepID=A0A6A6Q041_9PEZI|nr:P-loop containing nucleoside triphosphate hydrolase protein [Neohortaea acidophila]KAF2485642.1 P-loop containing nucleoside triphosphate hydrolase protein [Neohortaea acidophila]
MATLYKRYVPPKPSSTPTPPEAPPPAPRVESTLYKRYVPPKSHTTTTPAAAPLPAPRLEAATVSEDVSTKRKRERPEEEVAERKAKKLRKKSIDPATVKEQDDGSTAVEKDPSPKAHEETIDQQQGDFSHIKNIKKRHKLEKEARKARKAAEKDAIDGLADGEKTGQSNAAADTIIAESQPSPNTSDRVEVATLSSDRKADKKEKKKRKQKMIVPSEKAHIPEDNPAEENEPERSVSQPKKRQHKLETALQDTSKDELREQDEPEEHLRKHAGIMSKFAQSKHMSELEVRTAPQDEGRPNTPPVMLDLAPLPQPEEAPVPAFKPDLSTLPKWLVEPTIVSDQSKISFQDLQLEGGVVQHLSKLGFSEAMPVQTALIPMLLPPGTPGAKFLRGSAPVLPDIAVGAPTGSGKTIAYLLPLIESIKRTAGSGRLKALVVVPTRELVLQIAAVAESLSRGSSVRIGVATGVGSFKDEQGKIMKAGQRYDPEGYRALMQRADRINHPPDADSDEFEDYLRELEMEDARDVKLIQDAISTLVNHVPTYESAVDLLVATPGRLLEHLDHTLGFSLTHLEWFILDEADKLVDGQYDGFLDIVNNELSRPRKEGEQDARERYLRLKGVWNEQRERRVRKVVLSATMTRDASKLVDLRLKRPQMILVRGQGESDVTINSEANGDALVEDATSTFELPPTLAEYCVPVGDGSEKPLYLLEVLEKRMVNGSNRIAANRLGEAEAMDSSDSDSDSDSSESSTASSEDSSVSSDDDDETTKAIDQAQERNDIDAGIHPDRLALLDRPFPSKSSSMVPTILIFASSTESANRLAHLLQTMNPEWATWIKALTKTDSKQPFSNTPASQPIIVVSTDRAARGIDTIGNRPVTHVVQYDVPHSATSYIHRVGRTARAGKAGEAWTLYTHSEARWFHKGIVKGKSIKRKGQVEKTKVDVSGDDAKRERLEKAIAGMREEVHGGRKAR